MRFGLALRFQIGGRLGGVAGQHGGDLGGAGGFGGSLGGVADGGVGLGLGWVDFQHETHGRALDIEATHDARADDIATADRVFHGFQRLKDAFTGQAQFFTAP